MKVDEKRNLIRQFVDLEGWHFALGGAEVES